MDRNGPAEFLPVIPVRQTVAFPELAFPLRVGRARSSRAFEAARGKNLPILILAQREAAKDDPGPEDLYKVGTLCQIEKVVGSVKEGFQAIVRGLSRFRVAEISERDGILVARGNSWPDEIDLDDVTRSALLEGMKSTAQEILSLLPTEMKHFAALLNEIRDLGFLTHLASANLDLEIAEKQELLETVSLKKRAMRILEIMQDRKSNLQVQGEIAEKVSEKFGKQQREHILREQLRAIREELGEGGGGGKKADFREKIEKAGMPGEVKTIALDELRRLEEIGNAAPEAHVIRNYLDLLCALPWSRSAPERIDLVAARKILDEDHYGLPKIKDRILQYLAVLKLLGGQEEAGKGGRKGSILLFVGPPGVGKTSLGQSIARALGRAFVRVALGGLRDDSEIRGHRRTYIGAMPGRIIQSIKRSGQNNPVLILDEVDKLSAGLHGDPAAALLEVLDPEQNHSFTDHYLDVPFDLSRVFFIATANTLSIPAPLLDRMETIEISGYTTEEKFHIARTHLIPKQLREHGMGSGRLEISEEALRKVIHDYTREAGVRELQRTIAALCRASAETVMASPDPVRIQPQDLDRILGPERYAHEVAGRGALPGVVTGLAWTPAGGEILFIETTMMPGTGKLILTGQLGDVMKESAQIALSLVRSRVAGTFMVDYEKRDVHVHVPAGAIPKDGPSAGVAIATALASLFSGRSVDPLLAMTGELTLRGSVLPVGGIKEKVIAAHRAGIRKVVLSERNRKDLRDVPEEVKRELEFEFAESISDVFGIALGDSLTSRQMPCPPEAA